MLDVVTIFNALTSIMDDAREDQCNMRSSVNLEIVLARIVELLEDIDIDNVFEEEL